MNPFDLHGPAFLTLYLFGLALAIGAGMAIPAWRRPPGRGGGPHDAEALAYLAGGPRRFADTVLARLLSRGALAVEGRTLAIGQAVGGTPAEAAVLRLPAPVTVATAEVALAQHGGAVEKRLIADGAMIDAAAAHRLRWWQCAPYLALLGFGAIKVAVGLARDRPVGLLVALMLATAVFAGLRWNSVDRRTRAGERALRDAQARADRLRRAPTAPEMEQAVALFGTAVLAGSAYEGLHTMRRPASSDGGGGGGAGDDGGGGGDGGGCGGGCGGCGD